MRGRAAEVGGNEGCFQLIERIAVYLLVERDDVFDALAQVLARARDRLLHPVEEARLFLFGFFFG